MTREELVSLLGEAIHSSFRKSVDSPAAVQIHHLISVMPEDDWATLVSWIVDSLIPLTVTVDECTHAEMGPWRDCNFGRDEVRICLTNDDCDHVEKRVRPTCVRDTVAGPCGAPATHIYRDGRPLCVSCVRLIRNNVRSGTGADETRSTT